MHKVTYLPSPAELQRAVNTFLDGLDHEAFGGEVVNWADVACVQAVVGENQDGRRTLAVWIAECDPDLSRLALAVSEEIERLFAGDFDIETVL